MALFQPTNVIPSTLSGIGNGTVDALLPLEVSWQVNGNSPMVAYQVRIMQNDTDSTLKYDTGKVTLDTPFFGTNARGENQQFSMTIPAASLSAAGIVNGYANGYKLSIKQWWNANDYVDQTSPGYFITRRTPTIAMVSIDRASAFDYQDYTFTAHYTQAQGDTIDWVRWVLQAKQNGDYVTIDDTGPVYGAISSASGNIMYMNYTHNGFAIDITGSNVGVPIDYRIQCTVQTENGVVVSTPWNELSTFMNSSHIPVPLTLCSQRETDAVKIEMPKNFPVEGVAEGSYSFTEQNLVKWLTLPSGTSVAFGGEDSDSLDIKSNSPYAIYCKYSITSAPSHTVYLIANYGDYEATFTYGPDGFSFRKNNQVIWSTTDAASNGMYFAIAVFDDKVFFGTNVSGTVQTNEYAITPWHEGATLEALTISGPGIVRALHVTNSFTLTMLDGALQSPYSFWSYTSSIQFYGRFEGTLYTGFITDDTDSLSIYRKPINAPIFKLIANIPISQRVFHDYSALNQQAYQYFFMLMQKQNTTGYLYVQERHGVSQVTPCWWNYTVLCCDQNEAGDYIVREEYRFGMNLESGSVGNNNKPSMQTNFTRYPMRQPMSSNFRSGTLTSLIGRKVNDEYVDSVSLMDALYALSTNTLTKFLKTRKGQLFMIETSGPITMQIADKYTQQPAKIGLPWAEVGDASGVNILGPENAGEGLPYF